MKNIDDFIHYFSFCLAMFWSSWYKNMLYMGVPTNINQAPRMGFPVKIMTAITNMLHNVGAKYGQTSRMNSGSGLSLIQVVL